MFNQLPDGVSLTETSRHMTTSFFFQQSICRAISIGVKSTEFSSISIPLRPTHVIDSSLLQLKSSTYKSNEDQPVTENDIPINNPLKTQLDHTFLDSHENSDSKILSPIGQYNVNHNRIQVNSCRRQLKYRRLKSSKKTTEIDPYEPELSKDADQPLLNSSTEIYEYKSPFSKEYDQVILLQANNNITEWHLKDFYRDVKTPFEPNTNTKPVFEKCLKLARLQANTIKFEQRRNPNESVYNRLIKTAPSDNSHMSNINGNHLSRNTIEKDIHDLKHELRCSECKRLACVGNCTTAHEYHQYKRFIPFSSLSATRDSIPNRFNLRTQRSAIDFRPRTTQQTKLNPVVVVPLFQDESQIRRLQKKATNSALPGKLIRSHRRETLALL